MDSLPKHRVESIDLLKGLVMVIMALDHTRDYFHAAAFLYDPTDPAHTSLAIFFTRWITHFCAPAFSFLAGISAFLAGRRRTRGELSGFLLKRGLWLVLIEMTVVNFAWYFDVQFRTPGLLVIWALGISMIVLAGLIHLPRTFILIFSCVLIFGHNLLDGIHSDGSMLWSILHEVAILSYPNGIKFYIFYPLIPWIAVMSLGYWFGALYDRSYDASRRRKIYYVIGSSAIVLFLALRWTNFYGDPTPWTHYDSMAKSLIMFLNPAKYPPSLSYLLMTLGPSLIFLAGMENVKGRIVNFFSTFGKVPFFYYILHLYVIHIIAMIFAQLSGFGWRTMILSDWVTEVPALKGYGFDLWVTYAIWIGIILLLYPLCKKFEAYKMNHKEKAWLSYL